MLRVSLRFKLKLFVNDEDRVAFKVSVLVTLWVGEIPEVNVRGKVSVIEREEVKGILVVKVEDKMSVRLTPG